MKRDYPLPTQVQTRDLMSNSQINWSELESAARQVAANAYVPYSHFAVGAAILTADGHMFTGCNVENASFGLTNCAERTAVFAARAQTNMREVIAVCVYTPTDVPTPPCGGCRQVLNEFGPTMQVRLICNGKDVISTTLDQLLPGAFGPKNLD
ncbi:cytidine deaminase [Paludibacterium sp. THUN1379]|uniref:cytidine deaminase n=2 Tax=Paludibacterium TaxID=400060 RepID=UPI0030D217F4